MRTSNKYILLIWFILSAIQIIAQSTQTPLKIKQTRKYGSINQSLYDSTTYIYNDRNWLIQSNQYSFLNSSTKDLKVTNYAYDNQGLNTLECTNEYQEEKLKNGTKCIKTFDENQNLINTTYQENKGGQFFNTTRILNTYDEAHNLITKTAQEWVYVFPSRIWQNLSLDSMAYNVNGQITYHSKSRWEMNEWNAYQATQSIYNENGALTYFGPTACHSEDCRLSKEEIYTYNEVNQLISQSIRRSILSRGGWLIDSTLSEFAYHDNGQLAYQIDTTFIGQITWDSLVLSTIHKVYYDSLENITNELINRFENGQLVAIEEKMLGTLSNDQHIQYNFFQTHLLDKVDRHLNQIEDSKFDEMGNQIAYFLLTLNSNGDTLYLETDTSFYDANNRLLFQRKDAFLEGLLTPLSQNIYEFNEMGHPLIELRQVWENEAWITDNQTIYQYDQQYNLQFTEQYEKYNRINFNTFDDFYTLTYYQQPISVAIKEVSDLAFAVFPNPIKNYLWVNLENHQFLPAQATIHHLNGQLVFETIINTTKQLVFLPSLPNGSYFLQLQSAQFQATKKIILLH